MTTGSLSRGVRARKEVEVKPSARACQRCHGLGYIIIGEEYEDCPVCKGTGIK